MASRMATQRLSPTGNLLRNSRLFSLPPSLARPTNNNRVTQRYDSETATLPYPTQQALETTPSSLPRGDWGLKRSLPLKSTARPSTPTIKIQDIDSINHIADFDSAADHVLNLRKWQEIGLPVSKSSTQRRMFAPSILTGKSVFEREYDNTQRNIENPKSERWKYRGPWIAGQTAGDFKEYTERHVKTRKREFREFLRDRIRSSKGAKDRRTAFAVGGAPLEQSGEIDDSYLDHEIRRLRQEDMRAELYGYIEEFLDLPSTPKPSRPNDDWSSIEGEKGPPKTHPSAGLSYLRTASHTMNHPAFGPQYVEQPVRGRVLTHDSPSRAMFVGAGGVVMEVYVNRSSATNADKPIPFDPDIPGGAKLWLQPERMSVDPQGKINVQAKRADPKALEIYEPKEQPEARQPTTSNPVSGVSPQIPPLVTERFVRDNSPSKTTSGTNNKDSRQRRGRKRADNPMNFSSQHSEISRLVDMLKDPKDQ